MDSSLEDNHISFLKITHCRPIPERTLSTGSCFTLSRLRTPPSPGIGRGVDWYRYTKVSVERDGDLKCDVDISRLLRNNAVYLSICRASFLRIHYSIYISLHSPEFFIPTIRALWPGSVVGIATGYGLDGPGIESR